MDIGGGKKKTQDNIFMSNREKEIIIVLLLCLFTASGKAQWTKSDSLKLNRILNDKKEIQLNKSELQNIHLDNHIINNPLLKPIQINNIGPDETLPENAGKKIVLTMTPYKANTPYNWDPIFHCKIVQVNGQWEPQNGPLHYTDQSRATKLALNTTSIIAEEKGLRGLQLGHSGLYVNGGNISGLDLMFFLEKRFWDLKQNAIRKKTLDILKGYGKLLPTLKTKTTE